MRALTFCRYTGIGFFCGVLMNAHSIWHLSIDTSAAMQKELRHFLHAEEYLDALETRVRILEKRPRTLGGSTEASTRQ